MKTENITSAKIQLHTPDKTSFPNLALMKLSAYHKAKGDSVDWHFPLANCDILYSSCIFTAHNDDSPDDAICGGTGYGDYSVKLPISAEHIMPDYSLYPEFKQSLGFTTRGCIRRCSFCVVPKAEGIIQPYAEVTEFKRTDSNEVILMDNNILASEHGRKQMQWCVENRIKIDCNQGLDARLVDDETARLLSLVRWIRFIRFSCDDDNMIDIVINAARKIRRFKNREIFCYVLIKDVESGLRRVEALRDAGIDPFAMPYRDLNTTDPPPKELRNFARWVNHKAIFKQVKWKDYIGETR